MPTSRRPEKWVRSARAEAELCLRITTGRTNTDTNHSVSRPVTALPTQWVSRLRSTGSRAEKLSTTVAKMSTP